MELISLKLHNIFSYKDAYIDFKNINNAIFCGKTGSGKSAIFEGVFWTIYDKTARKSYHKTKVMRDVPKKQKECYGILKLKDGADLYTITRKYTKSNLNLILERNGVNISKRVNTQIQEQINEIIGVDADTMLNIAYYSQGDIGAFLTSDSSKRIEILSDLAGLGVIDSAVKGCNKIIRKQEQFVSKINGEIEVLTKQIGEIDLNEIITHIKNYKKRHKKLEIRATELSNYLNEVQEKLDLERQLYNLNDKFKLQKDNGKQILEEKKSYINKLEKDMKELEKAVEEKNEINEQLKNLEDLSKKRSEVNKDINEKNKQKYSFLEKADNLKKQIKKYQNLADKGLGVKCPTCLNQLDGECLEYLKNEISKIKIDKNGILDKVKKIELEEDELQKQMDKLQDELKEMDGMKIQKTFIETQEQNLCKTAGDLVLAKKRYRIQKLEIKQETDGLRHEIKQLKDKAETISVNTDEAADSESKLENIKDEMQEIDKNTETLKRIRNETQNKKKKLKKKQEEVKGEYSILQKAEFWKSVFPKIKLNMIKEMKPFLQSETNKFLSEIMSGKRIIFDIKPERANNKCDIIIEDFQHGVKRQFEGWSGGQKDEMSLCVFLSLNKLASMKSRKKIPFLILDEKFSSIDSESRNLALDILRKQVDKRKILVISHIDDMKEHFDVVFNVMMKNGISSIEKVE